METKEYTEEVEKRIEKIKSSLIIKGQEYHRDGNPFHNFEKGAKMTGDSRERILKGFMLKHLISIFDIIDNLDKNNLPSQEVIEEKCGDAINYLIILEVSVKEKIKMKNND